MKNYKLITIGILIGSILTFATQAQGAMSLWKYVSGLLQPVVSTWDVSLGANFLQFTEITTPSTPDANKGEFYVKDDGFGDSAPFFLSDSGLETQLGEGGGGGATDLPSLTDVDDALGYTDKFVLIADGTQYTGRALVEADIPKFYTASNGLTLDALNFKLGGTLTEATTIITGNVASALNIKLGGASATMIFRQSDNSVGFSYDNSSRVAIGGATDGTETRLTVRGGLPAWVPFSIIGQSNQSENLLNIKKGTTLTTFIGSDGYPSFLGTTFFGKLDFSSIATSNKTFTFPNQTGTVALSENTVNLTGDQSVAGIKTFSSFPILPSSNPATNYQATHKYYVDSVAQGLTPKEASRVASTVNLNLNGTSTIDAVDVIVGDRVLAKDQTNASSSGIYVVVDGPWTRATDYDTSAEVQEGTFTFISEGTVNAGFTFVQTTIDPILDTSDLVFVPLSAQANYTASLGVELVGVDFRADLLATGALGLTGNELKVNVDDSSIEIATNALQVKALGITNAMLAGSIADSKLSQLTTTDKVSSTAIAGIGALVQGDLIYGSGTDTLALLTKDANATRYLSNTGTSNNPAWAQVDLTNGVTGELPNANLATISTAGKVSGAALTLLPNIPSGAGLIPTVNLGTGATSTTTFLRGDQTWAIPEGGGGGGTSAEVMVVLGEDRTSSTTPYADVTGLSFLAEANTDYIFEFWIIFRSTATASGVGFAINGPAGATTSVFQKNIPISLTSVTLGSGRAYNLPWNTSASIDTANADTFASVKGILRNGANAGTFILRFRPETAGQTATVKAGSALTYRQITAGGGSLITGTDTHVMFFDGANNPAGEAGFVYNKTTNVATLSGGLKILDVAGDNFTLLQGGVQTADLTYTLPTGYPAVSGYVLSATDAGVMSWVAAGGHDAVTLDANAETLLSLSTQELGLDTQASTTVFAGPTTGANAVPSFRSLVSTDIPDLSGTYQPLDADLTAIGALGFTSTAFLKKTAADTWELDTNTYLTAEADTLDSVAERGATTDVALTLTGDPAITFDINDAVSTAISEDVDVTYASTIGQVINNFDFDLIYSGTSSTDINVWNETYFPSDNLDRFTAISHNIDITIDGSNLDLMELGIFKHTLFDVDYFQMPGIGFINDIVNILDFEVNNASAGYFAIWKGGGGNKFTVDISGNTFAAGTLEIDGTSQFDGAITANSTSQFNNTLTVGVNDTGYDVQFFGATSGKSFLWDESADLMNINASSTLSGNTTITGVMDFNGALTADAGNIVFNEDSGDYDFRVETNGIIDTLFVDGGADGVGINSSTTAMAVNAGVTLDIQGSMAWRCENYTAVNGANNNIAIQEASCIRITGPTAPFYITGIAGGADGRFLILFNTVAQNMTLGNSATSSAANQILTLTGADITSTQVATYVLFYDATLQKWINMRSD